MLSGKGLWAYRTAELDRVTEIAPQMGATHVIYKVGQGADYFDGVADIAEWFREAGLIPFAWTWLLLEDPQAEAQVVVRAFEDGFQGFVFDTEAEECRNCFEQAAQLGQHLHEAEIDLDRLYNCSFPNISHHFDLPYEQMNAFCKGGLMPMSYGSFFTPESTLTPDQQAQRVIDEWTYGHYEYWSRRWGCRPPLYPVLAPYHDEHANVRMGPDEFQVWLDRLAAHGPTFFSLFRAGVINDDLLSLIRACPLGDGSTPVLTGVQVEVVSPEAGYLNVRVSPSMEHPPIVQVYHGMVLESLEPEEDTRAKVGQEDQWLHVFTPGGITGYVAAWYLRLHEGDEEGVAGEVVEAVVRVEVVSPEVGFLNVRPTPSIAQPPITQVDDGAVLEALEPELDVQAKMGEEEQWLRVRTPAGVEGYVAARYLRLHTD